MLSYKKLGIDVLYDSISNDLIEEFYKPVLSNSVSYDRVSCYFSIESLLLLTDSIGEFLRNGGIARFIMSVEMSNKDFAFYQDTYNEDISKQIENEIDELIASPDGIPVNLRNLGYLIKMGRIQVKIAQKEEGLFHEKFAVCEDSYGNEIGFIGSLNETILGMKKNSESITTRKSFSGSIDDIRFLELKKSKFRRLWNNEVKGHHVIDLPDAIKAKVINISDNNYIVEESKNIQDFAYLNFSDGQELSLFCDVKKFTKTSRKYNTQIKPMILYCEDKYLVLKKMNSYIQIKKSIQKLRSYCESINLKLIIINELKSYLIQHDIYIEKRRELGTFIKNKDDFILEAFNSYKTFMKINLKRPLKESQLWDSFHCIQMVKSSNYSVPGTGKTAMVLAAFYYLKSIGEVSKLIVCGPLNSRKSWRDEIELVFHDENKLKFIDVKAFNKTEASKNLFFREQISAYDVIFINHDALKSLHYQLSNYNEDSYFICIDEMHKFKGNLSQKFELAYELFKDNRYKISLTGTPNPNGFQDFYSQLNILYTHEYQMFFGYSYNDLKQIGNDKWEIEKFNNLYQPFFCRTTKKDLSIKPPLPDNMIYVPMSKEEEQVYNDLVVYLNRNKLLMYIRMIQLTTIPENLDSSISNIDIEYITSDIEESEGLLRTVSMTSLPDDVISDAKKITKPSKIIKVIELIKTIIEEGRNVIVWAIFVDTHAKIKRELEECGIEAKIINGSVSVDERESLIDSFKADDFKVLIANPHTMAESVSLHKHCHDAIYVEYDFNLTHNLQSRDRIHRLGLPEDIDTRYYYLISCFANSHIETADQHTYNRLEEKREQMLSIVESQLIETIPVDDIYEILNLIV